MASVIACKIVSDRIKSSNVKSFVKGKWNDFLDFSSKLKSKGGR